MPISPRNRRAFDRHISHSGNVICRPGTALQAPDSWSGDVLDVSLDGVSLCLYRRFEPGTPLMVEMFGSGGLVSTTLGKVVRVKSFCDRWVLGCKLATKLGEEDLRALIGAVGLTPTTAFALTV